jgi:predicted AlkP superfamily phosphohydrolase/phosphomutase
MTRLLIIGLDGLSWNLLDPLLQAGVMPHLARFRDEGAWGPLTSVVPTQSASAWASFVTGQNPARHGVVDFAVRQPDGTYRHAKPHPASTLWHYLGRGGLQVGVLNFPITYPPDPVNGFLVSGMLSPKGRTFTYPPTLGDELLAAVPGYRIDLEWQLYAGREGVLLRDLTEMTRQRARACHYLLDHQDWHGSSGPDLLAIAFVGPDRLQHALWRHLDPSHPLHDAARSVSLTESLHAFYAGLDEAVGQLVTAVGEDATVILLSDHGFQSAAWQFRVDDWLAENGWLVRQAGRSRWERLVRRLDRPWVRHLRKRLFKDISRRFPIFAPGGTTDWSRTLAFSTWNSQQGIRLNVKGRDPEGIVAPGEDGCRTARLREEIRQALSQAREPRTGQLAVDRIWMREELYQGPFLEEMPDLVFTLRPNLAASPLQPGLWMSTGWASGDHSPQGMFIAWGAHVAPGPVDGARLIDVAPTALYLLGLPVPDDMDGVALVGALDPAFVQGTPIRRQPSSASARDAVRGEPVALTQSDAPEGPAPSLVEGEAMTAEEEAEIQARLRGLGYL